VNSLSTQHPIWGCQGIRGFFVFGVKAVVVVVVLTTHHYHVLWVERTEAVFLEEGQLFNLTSLF
jgi:hypothetical protein